MVFCRLPKREPGGSRLPAQTRPIPLGQLHSRFQTHVRSGGRLSPLVLPVNPFAMLGVPSRRALAWSRPKPDDPAPLMPARKECC